MSQVNPASRPNATKIIDCLTWLLEQISPANNGNPAKNGAGRAYATDGVVIERTRDPRKLNQDLATDFRRVGTLIKIRESTEQTLTGNKGIVGNSKRRLATLELICFQAMSDQQDRAKITADQIQAWLREDIDQALSNDDTGIDCITRASNSLSASAGPWGAAGMWGRRPTCIDLTIVGYINANPLTEFPNFVQTIKLSYLYDKLGPGRIPGVL